MFRPRGRIRERLERLIVLSSRALVNKRLQKVFYAVYCLGAIVGALLRTPFGRPWASMLYSIGTYWLRHFTFTVRRIAGVINHSF